MNHDFIEALLRETLTFADQLKAALAANQPIQKLEHTSSSTHKQVLVLRKDLKMRLGKSVAQGAHASIGALLERGIRLPSAIIIPLDADIRPWLDGRFKKICVSTPDEASLLELYAQAQAAGLPAALITDSGLTEFHGVPTRTALSIGPGDAEAVDRITGGLPLL
ncbi:peptidyl-tRNA hydrolase, PTH2 family [Novimethylophilus kurashikiensis]|uniref:peptidyl-tRNA hydrolase n=1 Tax=Novimethylophilus kurashikiensis TaxID=1825523 RepID=A0A2R5F7V5_9PROT|nr:aminoacyl-tRNA hydrolase [Novimethylophilus kurashikiensis]GBG14322.1 peptidyl-tRNA hydrolase, PTH2 family [Novimethylophilus kurashikiensis]